ncbi:MAG: hypothetical protein P8L85_08140, partial [Rubripirellula sp.]|nr:hypothetical protein [Rubripirellula sp.]
LPIPPLRRHQFHKKYLNRAPYLQAGDPSNVARTSQIYPKKPTPDKFDSEIVQLPNKSGADSLILWKLWSVEAFLLV